MSFGRSFSSSRSWIRCPTLMRMPRRAFFRSGLVAAVLVLGLMARAFAAGSAPTLAITTVDALVASTGVRSVAIRGTFNFEDLLQFSFPAGLIVFQNDTFGRYDLSGDVVTGASPLVSDGIIVSEVLPLLSAGAPAAVPASVASVRPDRLTIVLPSSFAPGPASIVLYGVVNDDPNGLGPGTSFLSNTIQFTLP